LNIFHITSYSPKLFSQHHTTHLPPCCATRRDRYCSVVIWLWPSWWRQWQWWFPMTRGRCSRWMFSSQRLVVSNHLNRHVHQINLSHKLLVAMKRERNSDIS